MTRSPAAKTLKRFKTNRTASDLGVHGISYAAQKVLVDQAIEHLPALNRQAWRNADLVAPVGRSLLAGLMRPVPVVMTGVLAED
jgi:hypothetical protein